MEVDGRARRHLRPRDQQRRRPAARADRGHRRRRDRRRSSRRSTPTWACRRRCWRRCQHGVLPIGPDRDVADVLARSLKKRGTDIHAEARVGGARAHRQRRARAVRDPEGLGEDRGRPGAGLDRPPAGHRGHRRRGGRRPRSTSAGSSRSTPTTMQTSRPGVYAVGDCVATPGLAHVAYAEAVVAVERILGEEPAPVDYGKVPWVVYTHPEVAWAGMTEAEAREAGLRRRGAQALDGRQRPGHDPRRDRRPGEGRRAARRPDPRLPHGRARGPAS